MKTVTIVVFLIGVLECTRGASAVSVFSDVFEYADQTALDAVWEPGVSYNGLTLTTEQNHSAEGSKCVKSTIVQDVASHIISDGLITDVSIEYWMYDSGGSDAYGAVFSCTQWISEPVGNVEFGVFPWGGGYNTNYSYRAAGDNWTRTDTGIARTVGWHKIVFEFHPTGGSIYFDDQHIVDSAAMTATKILFLGNPWQSGTTSLYFDDVDVEHTADFPDDFEYADQSALDAFWEPGSYNGLTLTTEQNHTVGGTKSVKSNFVNDIASYALSTVPLTNVSVQYWFYDTGDTDTYGAVFACSEWIDVASGTVEFGIFPWGGGYSTNYSYKAGNDWTRTDSGISRSVGWHKVVFKFHPTGGSIYFDDGLIAESSAMTSTKVLFLGNPWDGSNSLYFDDVDVAADWEAGWFDDLEYSSQAAFETEWPGDGIPLTLTSEMNHTLGGSRSARVTESYQQSRHDFAQNLAKGTIEIWMYDPGNVAGTEVACVDLRLEGASYGNYSGFGVNAATGVPETNYFYYLYSSGGHTVGTGPARSQGWHQLLFTFGVPDIGGSIYFDGQHITDNDNMLWGCNVIRIGNPWWPTTEAFYYDDFSYVPDIVEIPDCGDWGYYAGDINRDCYVDMSDVLELAQQWLICSSLDSQECD